MMVVRGLPFLVIRRSTSTVGNRALRSLSTTVAANAAGGEAAPVAVKKSRAGLWFVAIAGAAGIGVLAYPQLVTAPATLPAPLPSPPTNPPVAPAAVAAATSTAVVDPPPKPKVLSPREELDQRVSSLKDELTALRKEKRSKLVDMKKRSVKDEIKMIQTGIAKIEKEKKA